MMFVAGFVVVAAVVYAQGIPPYENYKLDETELPITYFYHLDANNTAVAERIAETLRAKQFGDDHREAVWVGMGGVLGVAICLMYLIMVGRKEKEWYASHKITVDGVEWPKGRKPKEQ